MRKVTCRRVVLLFTLIAVFIGGNIYAQGKESWADSIYTKAAGNEESLQWYLDSLGYNIDVANDELGWEVFCGLDGVNSATMVIEVAGSAVWATSGYYKAGDTSIFYQLFGPSDQPGDSVEFTFENFDSIGFYMKPNLPSESNTWLTENSLNWDGYDHAWVFSTGVPHEYLICWEDLPNGGDEDYQDLVIKVTFANDAPELTLPKDSSVILCASDSICFDIVAHDPNCESDSIWLEMLEGEGTFTPLAGVSTIEATHCFYPTDSGLYQFVFRAEDELGAVTIDTATIYVSVGSVPQVEVPDTTFTLCEPAEVCIPVSIFDPDCDITSVSTNYGTYTGTMTNFDQIDRILSLGGTVTQIGGGAPGKVLTSASDFVPPVNSQSGVSVTLPNFVFADHIVKYGSFPGGTAANSADQLLGPPTDLTFTSPGPGGPDGGDGDGSVSFGRYQWCIIGFPQAVTTCNGANVDLVIFTNSNSGAEAKLIFKYNGTVVHVMRQPLPSGSAGSGIGGATIDLPDGITFNQLKIKNVADLKCHKNLEIDAVAVRTSPSSTSDDICFDVDTSGVYEIIVTATDSCGNVGADTALVTVNLNSPPVADAGADFTAFMCDFEEVCFPVDFSDPDGNLDYGELYSGPGSLNGDNICFTPSVEGAYTFVIHAVDSCGEEDFDTVVVTVETNDPPVANDPDTLTVAMCEASEQCYDFTATDPNGGTLTWSHLAGAGSITPNGHFCFTPTTSGTYSAAVVVTDSCGASDTATIVYDVTVNTPPVASDPASPIDTFLCVAEEICYQFEASDSPDDSLTWQKLSGTGSVTVDGLWCFTPTSSGAYNITVVVTDTCGAADTTTLTYNVTVNGSPNIAFGNDTSLLQCVPEEICIAYTVSDPQGLQGLTEAMVSGYGTIDTAANTICFTPTAAGAYEFIARVTDSCGATDEDTIIVNVTFGEQASIDCPTDPIDVSLCSADTVCQLLTITPDSATVTTSYGTYENGTLCFFADTSGTYLITVTAETQCGADTCELTFNVDIGSAAEISCPQPQSEFICEADTICVPVSVLGTDVTVEVSPIGSYSAGNVCFPADTSGHYEITMIATTTCGSDTCVIVVDVTINSNPVAVEPSSPVDTFICAADQICYQFDASDVDGGTLVWSRLSGNGTVSADGLWCFDANASGSYSVEAVVSDSCGAADTVSLTYNVTINSTPSIAFGEDTSIFQCTPDTICLPYSVSDADNNIDSVILVSAEGTLDTAAHEVCFAPLDEGTYELIVQVFDACGATDIDTIHVTVDFNDAPLVDAGSDQTIFQCSVEEICWAAGATDPDDNLISVELVTGPGTFDGSQICFTPTGTYNYEFVLKATDACGVERYDTVAIYYTLNTPPVADAGADQTLFLCEPEEICWSASCSDVDGNLTNCILVEGPGSYDGSNICFTPSATGTYTFVIEATDACGATDRDTAVIDVTINSAPVCTVPNDTTIFQCTAEEVCLPAYGTDVDGNLNFCQIVSGPGSLIDGKWCYTPVSDQTVTVTMRCEDSCGAYCETQFTVEFNINDAPSIAFGNDTSIFLCASEEICLPYIANDPDRPRADTITLVSGEGGTLDLDSSWVCFTPTETGTYTFVIRIEDECGEFDQDTINVDVTLNTPPVADAGADQTLFLCDSVTTVCWEASCSDIDNNLTDCLFNGPGTYDGSQICFVPVMTGDYLFTLRAIDACGEEMVDSVTIHVTINSDPVVTFGNDTTLLLCAPQEICMSYNVSDADGLSGITERMVSGYGTIDTAANTVCFTPTSDGTYEFVVSAEDSCLAVGMDTIVANITFGEVATIDCPTGAIDVYLCAADSVCYLLDIQPGSATVDVSLGTFDNGTVCFYADTSGTYVDTVIASEVCGADTCVLVFNVDIGSAADIECPAPQDEFICSPDTICIPITVVTPGDTVTVEPIGWYDAGNVCFMADTSGHYVLTVIASTSCGSDTCEVIADVTINSPPVADDPPSPIDTFICANTQICYQFSASDVDGGSLEWHRLSGDGTVSADGLWCFTTTNRSVSYSVTAEVADECGATDTISMTYNATLNSPPTLAHDTDLATFQCAPESVCVNYWTSDADDNITLEELISGQGTIDTAANTICFLPDTAGTYRFILKVTDACGATDSDTIDFSVTLNRPPVAFAGDDRTVFLCDAEELCWPVTISDPDGNLDSVSIISSVGTYDGANICFTPDTAGVYTIILRAVDVCGEADMDTVLVYVSLNSPPVCELPNDTTFFQCTPTEVSLPINVTDDDNNFDHCEIITGPGSIVNGKWYYTPTADQTVLVKIMCLDACGAMCEDSFTVSFEINSPPVVDAGADETYFLCQPETICWETSVTDDDGNIQSIELVSPDGSYNPSTHEICFTPPTGDNTYEFILKATDSCGADDYDTVTVTITYNSPPTLELPPDFTVYLDEPGDVCFDAHPEDVDGNLTNVTVSPFGWYDSGSESVCFTADTSGTYCLIVTAEDACHASVTDTVCLTLEIDECIHVMIEKTHDSYQGHHENVEIYLNGSGKELGGFDLLVAYDRSALNFQTATAGDLFDVCGWEYFTHRVWFWPSYEPHFFWAGIVRLVGIADMNNGANHPSCYLDGTVGSLASLDFLVSDNRQYECQYVPIRFFWNDCGDNSFSSRSGDTLWISRSVYDFELNEITDYNYSLPGYFGAPDECLIGGGPGKPAPIRCVDFTNGGIDIVCADSIDARGDINLNGVPNEVADAVVFTNYFIYGLSAFTINVEGQIAATDVNADGLTLTVGDLVFLIRVVIGDTPPMPKAHPTEKPKAEFSLTGGILSIAKTDSPIGALYLTIAGNVHPTLTENAGNMKLRYNFDGTDTRVLIYDLEGKAYLEEGSILDLHDKAEVKTIEAGSFDGAVMVAKITDLPEHFSLSQNYPNPFNPTTTIEFALPVACEWNLVVYNILGQEVQRWNQTSEAGYIKVEWDASNCASGVYFYRLQAGDFTATKKMLLLK